MNLENLPRYLILFTYDIKEVKSYVQAFFAEKEERVERLIDLFWISVVSNAKLASREY